jgi:hypothetical protein
MSATTINYPTVKLEEGLPQQAQAQQQQQQQQLPREWTMPAVGESTARALTEIAQSGVFIKEFHRREGTYESAWHANQMHQTKLYHLPARELFVYVYHRSSALPDQIGKIAYRRFDAATNSFLLHNPDGPALITPEGIEEYWLDGVLGRSKQDEHLPTRYVVHSGAKSWYRNGSCVGAERP